MHAEDKYHAWLDDNVDSSDFVFSVGGSVQLIPHLELISDLCSSQAFRTRITGNFDHDDNEDEDNNYDDPTCNRKFVQKPTVL